MKYLVVVPDGAADDIDEEYFKTPLEIAEIPHMHELARRGSTGRVKTVPDGVPPGSDAANLAVLGYDPEKDLSGRSPLEAVSMGIELGDRDVSFRTNLVTLEGNADNYEDLIIKDHASGDIPDEDGRVLIEYIDSILGSGDPKNGGRLKFYPGISYRHAMVIKDGPPTENGFGDVYDDYKNYNTTPPHDILTRRIGDYLPLQENEKYFLDMMKKSYELLKNHDINKQRVLRGLNPANSLWMWGMGTRPMIKPLTEIYGIDGSVIAAVDLIKGIGICAGLEPIDVPGADGTIHSYMKGKADAAIGEFKRGKDLVFVHIEAPDECAHQGSRAEKIKALERVDAEVLGPLLDYLRGTGEDFKVLLLPDHKTPVKLRTHTNAPVPYVVYDSLQENYDKYSAFTERAVEDKELIPTGAELAKKFFSGMDEKGQA
ncbi:MAG: cofactor-independent phosphoglycerate mutase [Clostridiales Family XIII bacterium]|jgi:2,3-bisphosphoglycerate-independent phosphoglycerate mutase|nr:cofactor-independent phosphoglycerate mutase [Clostridiales Family XIII bacterium]